MLTRVVYNAMKDAFGQAIQETELPTFKAASLEEQQAVVKDIVDLNRGIAPLKDVGDQHIACFILLFHLKFHEEFGWKQGSKEHYALRERLKIPPPLGWPKANPPKSFFELMDGNRDPSWAEEHQKSGEMADMLDFESAHFLDDIVSAIKTVLGIGGLEDLYDERAIPSGDETMKLFTEAVMYALSQSRSAWFANKALLQTLPQGMDGRRAYDIKEELRQVHEAEKLEVKRNAEKVRREKVLKEHSDKKEKFFVEFEKLNWKPIVDEVAQRDFQEFKDEVDAKSKANRTWIPSVFMKEAAKFISIDVSMTQEQANAKMVELANVTEQFLFTKLNTVQPGWFTTLLIGDFKLRKAAVKAPGLTRAERSTRAACARIAVKYSMLELAKASLAVLGDVRPVHLVFGALPEKPQAGLEETPAETPAEPTPAAAGE